jgi:TetR/AcrR family transcriptional repressor of nem operon
MSDRAPRPHACGPGRPRAYDREAALEAALDVFWRRGYEAASLDELTEAMGVSRSSFYACFGSKRGALLAAFEVYNRRGLTAMQAAAAAAPDGRAAVRAVLRRMADPGGDPRGCFLVNAIAELSAADPELAAAGRSQIGRIAAVIAARLAPRPDAEDAALALVALGLGVSALRKAGADPERLEALLIAAEPLLAPPG